MTSDSTTDSSPWHSPSGTSAGEGSAPAPPFAAAYVPGPDAPSPYAPSPYAPSPYAPSPYAPSPYPVYGAIRGPSYGPPPGKGMALGALWTGLGSLVLGFFSVGVLGIVGGIVGLVLGMVALRRAKLGTATGSETATFGIAVSLVSIVLGGLLLLAVWPTLVDAFEQGWEQGSQS